MKKQKYLGMLLALMACILVIFTIATSIMGKTFWQIGTLKSIAMQFPEYGVITLGLMFCFILGKIDMSFVALGDFATIAAVKYMGAHYAEGSGSALGVILVGVLIALAIAAVGGVVNGLLIAKLNIPPVMATIAMQLVWTGISIGWTQGYAVSGLPALYTEIGHSYVFGFIPFPLLVFLIIFVICWFLLNKTVYGEKLYMVGSNIKAAKFSGINTDAMVIGTFVLCDVIACIGCLLMISTLASAKADYGTSYVMTCILILVLAGVLPDGGMGKIINVLVSIVTIQIISTGVNMLFSNNYMASLIWGGLLILVLIFSAKLNSGAPLRAKKKASA